MLLAACVAAPLREWLMDLSAIPDGVCEGRASSFPGVLRLSGLPAAGKAIRDSGEMRRSTSASRIR
jgi:hypothetical protein